MKAKLNLNGAAFKDFFIHHGEKIVLGVVVLLLLNFAYGAITANTQVPGTPEQIKKESDEAQVRINKTTWDEHIKDKPEFTQVVDFKGRTDERNKPLEKTLALSHTTPLSPRIFDPLTKRADPKLLPVIELTGKGMSALVPYLQDQKEIAAALPDPQFLPKRKQREEEAKKKREKKKEGGEVPEGVMLPPGVMQSRNRREEEPVSTQIATDRAVGGAPLPGARGTGMRLEPKYFAVVTGLVPFEEQYKEYKKKFEDALGKDITSAAGMGADQFTPQYIYWYIERSEVKDHRDKNFAWNRLDVISARKDTALWGQANPQGDPPIDPLYSFAAGGAIGVDPNGWSEYLEWPLPPMILRDWGFEVTHPKVPFLKNSLLDEMQEPQFFEPGKGPAGMTNPGAGTMPTARAPRGGPMMAPRGMGGPQGMGGRMGGEFGGMMRRPSPMMGGVGGMGGMRGVGGMGGEGYGNGMSAAPQVPYKLYRYVDMTCEKGKRYRYRVQLMVRNPNFMFPAGYLEKPESAKQEFLLSEWSEPSSVIEIPMNGQVLAAGSSATGSSGEMEGIVSMLELTHWEKKEDKKKTNSTSGVEGGGLGLGMMNTEPTEGWVEVLKEGLKLPLGGIAYFVNEKVEKVLDMAVEIEKKKIEGLTLSAQEAMLLDVRSDDSTGGKSKGVVEMLFFRPDGRLIAAHSGVDRQKSEDYKDRTFVSSEITGGAFPGMGPRGGFGPPGMRGGGKFGGRGLGP
ncbi:MAG: hypothetical protein IT427_10100 [Pirellulales bacterium]|nr:hypothetical protein [Pirellulales bacterium]